jgi:hypothetical protein
MKKFSETGETTIIILSIPAISSKIMERFSILA